MKGGEGVELMSGTNDVVVVISGAEEGPKTSKQTVDSEGFITFEPPIAQLTEVEIRKSTKRMPPLPSSSSPDISKLGPTPNTPPKIPDESVPRRRLIARSAYSKPKSRLVEPPYPSSLTVVEESTQPAAVPASSPYWNSPNTASPLNATTSKENERTASNTPKTSTPITPKTPLMASTGGEADDDDEVYKTQYVQVYKKLGKKLKFKCSIELISFVCIVVFLIASLTVHKLRDCKIWGLEIWKWCVLVLVIFCGRLVTEWVTNVLVFLIERNFLFKKKVLYFVYNLQHSVRVFVWLGLVLLAWCLLINRGVKRSRETARILNYITRALASSLIGATMWVVKTLLVKLLASSFHVKKFFDRIQESIFHQYVLRTLSGPPLMEYAQRVDSSANSGHLSFKSLSKEKKVEKEEVIDVEKLHKIKREKISAWTMVGLVQLIMSSGLSTISEALEESVDDEGGSEQKERTITSEWEAKAAAYQIFKNVSKPRSKYIDEEDLLRFMNTEEVDNVLPLFAGAVETGKIKKSVFWNWVVNVYKERKCLAHSLNDTKTGIEELNKVVSGIVLVAAIIVWLLLMGFATTQVLVVISSQLLLVVFVFGNTCKTAFEAIIFVFVMHPFDVGDRCVIDGVQMVVEEMNILTTIFLRYDNEKIYYPNSILATKPISNFNRSPDMSDSVEFAVDVSTSAESIAALKAKIKAYLDSKPQHWRPGHSLQVKEIVDVNKMTMGLYVTHTMNFQNSGEKGNRRSDLVFELKKIFEELGIKYHLLPQEVHITYVGSASPTVTSRQ